MYKFRLRHGLVLVCSLLAVLSAGPVKAASNFETFTFAPRANVAEILYNEHGGGLLTAPKAARRRILAQGTIHLPRDAWLEIHLRYDAPEQMQCLEQLARLPVTSLQATDLDINDEQLSHIKNFKPLYHLNLHATLVTDKSMPMIGTFKELLDLRLSSTNIKGTGFAYLNGLTQLTRLNLAALPLVPGAVAKFKPLMARLIDLNLSETGLTKEDCASLASLAEMRHLDISSNRKIDNDSVAVFSHMPKLSFLAINDTGITDKSIALLMKLPHLTEVIIRRKDFWKTVKPQEQIGHLRFIDVVSRNAAPTDIFEPTRY